MTEVKLDRIALNVLCWVAIVGGMWMVAYLITLLAGGTIQDNMISALLGGYAYLMLKNLTRD